MKIPTKIKQLFGAKPKTTKPVKFPHEKLNIAQKCIVKDCAEQAVYCPYFFIHALGLPSGTSEIPIACGLGVCEYHKGDKMFDTFFSEKENPGGNKHIKDMFRSLNMAEPDFEDMRIEWNRI